MLESSGFSAYCIGGCARDSLLNKKPKDWDLTTNAKPKEIKEVFRHKFNLIDIGERYGTIGVILDSGVVEITTFRAENSYKNGRHPESINFESNLKADVLRRDFTINALAIDSSLNVIDLVGGLNDLDSRILKSIGDAKMRFSEDYLRILRALRFYSVLEDFSLDSSLKNAIFESYKNLNKLPKERIKNELELLLKGNNAYIVLNEFSEVFCMIFNIQKLESKLFKKPTKDLSFTLALIYINEYIDSVYNNLKLLTFSNSVIKEVLMLLNYKDCKLESKIELKNMLNNIGIDSSYKILEFRKIFKKESLKNKLDSILKNNECFNLKMLNISGEDLKNIGLKNEKIRIMLNILLDSVIQEKLENSKQILIDYAITLKENI